jgi:hypothetical protein
MSNLAQRAMLTALHISAYSGNMFDREATEDSIRTKRLIGKAGRYNKKLIDPVFFSGVSELTTMPAGFIAC